MDQISGYIENIVYASESGFIVAKLQESNKRTLTYIIGTLASIRPGETLQCEGLWKHHPKFGKQFEVSSFIVRSPSDLIGIQKYLESGLVKGIGPVYAKKIVDTFGLETLHVIDMMPIKLLKIPGIGKKRVGVITKYWDQQKSIREVMIFLRSIDISPAYAQKIYKKYGENSENIIKENPYHLAQDVFGIGFKIADNIAKNLKIEKDSPKRIEAGISFVLSGLSKNGHTCFPEKEFLFQAQKILEVEEQKIKPVLEKLIQKKMIIRERITFQNKSDVFSIRVTNNE